MPVAQWTPPTKSPRASIQNPLTLLALPGMYLYYKYNDYRRRREEELQRQRVTEQELENLTHRIDKLLAKIDDSESEIIQTEAEEECVVCLAAKATMQTYPCGHTVVCRKCFIKTIQMALSQRCLPLRCVICRTRILKLRQLSETKSRETSEPKKRSQQNHFKLLPRIRQFKASMKAK